MTTMGRRKILFIGGGQMAVALLGGLLRARQVSRSQVHIVEARPDRRRWLHRRFRVVVSAEGLSMVRWADVVLACVKPQQLPEILKVIGAALVPRQLLISIAAGVRTQTIDRLLPRAIPVVRVMPNLPATVGAGAAAMTGGRWAKASHLRFTERLLGSVGLVLRLPETRFDAVTAVSGSGPAYVFYLAEAMQAAAQRCGLPRDVAEKLVRQTVLGAAQLLAADHASAEDLRARVTSPGGTTAAAVRVLEGRRVKAALIRAVQRAAQRSRELSQ